MGNHINDTYVRTGVYMQPSTHTHIQTYTHLHADRQMLTHKHVVFHCHSQRLHSLFRASRLVVAELLAAVGAGHVVAAGGLANHSTAAGTHVGPVTLLVSQECLFAPFVVLVGLQQQPKPALARCILLGLLTRHVLVDLPAAQQTQLLAFRARKASLYTSLRAEDESVTAVRIATHAHLGHLADEHLVILGQLDVLHHHHQIGRIQLCPALVLPTHSRRDERGAHEGHLPGR
mmetsp:Transcript_27398/g.68386  ORF Transcript_27398/g.68386 Transcript_27398/m.68386 type:complete len:232 (-) Transcript_27398:361-1056(-)